MSRPQGGVADPKLLVSTAELLAACASSSGLEGEEEEEELLGEGWVEGEEVEDEDNPWSTYCITTSEMISQMKPPCFDWLVLNNSPIAHTTCCTSCGTYRKPHHVQMRLL